MNGTTNTLRRGCFALWVKTDLVSEFREVHHAVWPEYLEAMRTAGIVQYSSFLSDDGLFIGYLESVDPERSLAQLGATDIDQRWQRDMQKFWNADAGGQKSLLVEAFDLDTAQTSANTHT